MKRTKNFNIKKELKKNPKTQEILEIMEKIAEKGFSVFIAGGGVRDFLLHKKPKDIDLAVSAKPEELLKIFPSAKNHFAKYGLSLIPLKTKEMLEVTSFRKDSHYEDGRRPQSISYSSAKEDALRRDFTINSLFYDPLKEEIIDFTGGLEDLKNKIIKTNGSAQQRFEEDHLRILRALRLAHQLDFQLEESLQKSLPLFAEKIKKISRERIVEELFKMFSAGKMAVAIQKLKDYSIFPLIFPTLNSQIEEKYIDFWNKEFSFYDEPAFCWTVFALPFFHKESHKTELFLKNFLMGKNQFKKVLSYLKAVQSLTKETNSLSENLKLLEGKKQQVLELSFFWWEILSLDSSALKKIQKEFEKREKEGKLPPPLVKGEDLLKLSPPPPRKLFSSLIQKAFEYQMQKPLAKKSEILKYIAGEKAQPHKKTKIKPS